MPDRFTRRQFTGAAALAATKTKLAARLTAHPRETGGPVRFEGYPSFRPTRKPPPGRGKADWVSGAASQECG